MIPKISKNQLRSKQAKQVLKHCTIYLVNTKPVAFHKDCQKNICWSAARGYWWVVRCSGFPSDPQARELKNIPGSEITGVAFWFRSLQNLSLWLGARLSKCSVGPGEIVVPQSVPLGWPAMMFQTNYQQQTNTFAISYSYFQVSI